MGERTAWQKKYAQESGNTPVFKKGVPFFARFTDRLEMGSYGIVEIEGVQIIAQVVTGGLRLYQAVDSTWVRVPGAQYRAIAEIIGVQGEKIGDERDRQAGV